MRRGPSSLDFLVRRGVTSIGPVEGDDSVDGDRVGGGNGTVVAYDVDFAQRGAPVGRVDRARAASLDRSQQPQRPRPLDRSQTVPQTVASEYGPSVSASELDCLRRWAGMTKKNSRRPSMAESAFGDAGSATGWSDDEAAPEHGLSTFLREMARTEIVTPAQSVSLGPDDAAAKVESMRWRTSGRVPGGSASGVHGGERQSGRSHPCRRSLGELPSAALFQTELLSALRADTVASARPQTPTPRRDASGNPPAHVVASQSDARLARWREPDAGAALPPGVSSDHPPAPQSSRPPRPLFRILEDPRIRAHRKRFWDAPPGFHAGPLKARVPFPGDTGYVPSPLMAARLAAQNVLS